MIYSMTAFARAVSQDLYLVCELRSVNHRYLEIHTHTPEALRAFDMEIREMIRQHLQRGKVECSIRFDHKAQGTRLFRLNELHAQELVSAAENIAGMLRNPAPISPTEIITMPGVLVSEHADESELKQALIALMQQGLADLVAARGREGEQLQTLFLDRIIAIADILKNIRKKMPQIVQEQYDRIHKRFADVKLDLDMQRLEQEVVLFSQRIDVAEEIDRAETHLREMQRVLTEGGVVGRRLDFLLQELNREANTLGSKSSDTEITHAVVDFKVLIEQIREQVQNVE